MISGPIAAATQMCSHKHLDLGCQRRLAGVEALKAATVNVG
jgi:hypothetical protein